MFIEGQINIMQITCVFLKKKPSNLFFTLLLMEHFFCVFFSLSILFGLICVGTTGRTGSSFCKVTLS